MALLAEAFVRVRPDFTGFGAMLRAELLKQGAAAATVGGLIGDQIGEGLRKALRGLKQDLAQAGVADIFDINVPYGKLYEQAILLKRILQRAGVSDVLDVNLNVAQIQDQIGKLAKETIPLRLVADTTGIAGLSLPTIAEHISIGGLQQAESEFGALGGAALALQRQLGGTSNWATLVGQALSGATFQASKTSAAFNAMAAAAGAAAGKGGSGLPAFSAAAGAAAGQANKLATAASAAAGAAGGKGGAGGTGLAGMAGAAAGAAGAGRAFGVAWGTLIGGVALWHLALDLTIESLVSVTEALAAFGLGVVAIQPSVQDLFTNFTNLQNVSSAFGVNLPPLTGALSNLQQAMAPQTIELYGSAINVANRNTGFLASAAKQVVTMFDDWAAKLNIWANGQKTFGALLQQGITYLGQFAKIFGTVVLAISNLLTKDPGIAHFLLDFIQGLADVLLWLSKLPGPLVVFGLALHGVYLYGSLLGGLFARGLISTGLADLAVKAGIASKAETVLADGTRKVQYAFLGLSGVKWGFLAFIAAGLGYVVAAGNRAQDSMANFINTMKTNLNNLPADQAFVQTGVDIGTLNAKLAGLYTSGNIAKVAQQIEHTGSIAQTFGFNLHGMWSSLANVFTSRSFSDLGRALSSLFTPGGNAAQAARQAISGDARLINDAISSLLGGYRNMAAEIGSLMGVQNRLFPSLVKVGDAFTSTDHAALTYQQALAVMDLAGVRANDSFAVMQQKVANLEKGYADASLSGSLFTNSLDAMNFASLQQQSNISAVTGGFDAFFKTVSGGESGFNSFATAMTNLNTSLKAAHASLTGINPPSITARSNFLAAAQAAQTEMDNLMTLASAAGAGAQGTQLLANSARDMIAPMLGAAKNSAGLTQILIALATQGGAQNITTFKQLAKWVGNVRDPMGKLDKNVTTLTVDAGNLTKDVQNLSTALGTTLNGAMSTAILDASGGQQAFTNFADAVVQTGADSGTTQTAAGKLASEIFTMTGNVQQSKDMFVTFAMEGLHLTKTQADLLWQQSLPALQRTINNLHGKNVDVGVIASGTGTITADEALKGAIATHIGSISFHKAGGLITTGSGPTADDQLVAVSRGETIVSAAGSKMLAPYFAAIGVPGYQAGGLIGGISNPNVLPDWVGNNAAGFINAGWKTGGPQFMNRLLADAKQYVINQLATVGVGPGVIGGTVPSTPGTPNSNAALAQRMFPQWSVEPYWGAWNYVAMAESGWNQYADNPSSGAYGIPQALPYTKMPRAAWPNWAGGSSDPSSQIGWMAAYMSSVYGGPVGAAQHEAAFHWYDNGGWLPPGPSLSWNGTGQSEVVSPASKFDEITAAIGGMTDAVCQAIDALNDTAAASPTLTGSALGDALNGMAKSSGYAAIYRTRP